MLLTFKFKTKTKIIINKFKKPNNKFKIKQITT